MAPCRWWLPSWKVRIRNVSTLVELCWPVLAWLRFNSQPPARPFYVNQLPGPSSHVCFTWKPPVCFREIVNPCFRGSSSNGQEGLAWRNRGQQSPVAAAALSQGKGAPSPPPPRSPGVHGVLCTDGVTSLTLAMLTRTYYVPTMC